MRSKNTQFKKGQAPWNKGLKGRKYWMNLSGLEKEWGWNRGLKMPQISGENHPNWKGGKPKCKECGKKLSNKKNKLQLCFSCFSKYYKGDKVWQWKGGKENRNNCIDCGEKVKSRNSKRCRKCFLKTMKGETSIAWRGGKTSLQMRIRSSPKYKEWIRKILERDEFTCTICGKIGGELHVHHIIDFSLIIDKLKFEQGVENLYEKAMDYDLLWDINNGKTLCLDCHKLTDNYLKNKKRIN